MMEWGADVVSLGVVAVLLVALAIGLFWKG